MNKKQTHTSRILSKLLKGETLISSDYLASNANQYFCNIKDHGIELIEWCEPSEGKHKKRKLNDTGDNIHKAELYLKRLLKQPA